MSFDDLYCSRADVMRRLPVGAVSSPASLVASSLASSNTITLDGHGLETNDAVTVRASAGGSLSSPLAEGTTYYVIRVSNSEFQLSATSSGSAIDLTTDGSEMVIVKEPSFDEHIQFYSRWADGFLPAHLVPLQAPIHPLVAGVVADCVAKRVLNIAGHDSAIVAAVELAGKAILERYVAGMQLRGATATSSANKAIVCGSGSTTASDPRGWGSRCLP